MRDLYALLRVSRTASKGEIKQAYRLLALKHHPDVQQQNSDGGTMFRALTEAYQILVDDAKRRNYDMTIGVRHVRQQQAYSAHSTQYRAKPRAKPGPISKEEHKFDYEEWKAWHYGDNAYVQSNVKQNNKGWMHMEGNSQHQQYYQRQASSKSDSAVWREIRHSREQVVQRAQQRREQRRFREQQEAQENMCTIS